MTGQEKYKEIKRSGAVLYSCTFANYDWTFSPLAGTPGMQFVRFIDRRQYFTHTWKYKPIPSGPELTTQTLTNRSCKLFPGKLFPEAALAVYIDGNILVKSDISPLLDEFLASGADIALFPHPSGRTVAEEIEFALLVGRIPQTESAAAEKQRADYVSLGVIDDLITENSIIFWNLASPLSTPIGEVWWRELRHYTLRDQISLPAVLKEVGPRIHFWGWHFNDGINPYFTGYTHKPRNKIARARALIYLMKDYYLGYYLIFRGMKAIGVLRRSVRRLLGRR